VNEEEGNGHERGRIDQQHRPAPPTLIKATLMTRTTTGHGGVPGCQRVNAYGSSTTPPP
jgi:hypothetical protein